MRIHFFHVLGTAWISASYEKFKKPLTLKCLCFPIFWELYGLMPHTNYARNLQLALECLCFPICFTYYENSVFGIAWVSISRETECGI